MEWCQTIHRIAQHFYIFNCKEGFRGIRVDMLTEKKFPIENKTEIFPSILWSKNGAS